LVARCGGRDLRQGKAEDMETRAAHFTHRSCYVNFGEHLQNAWNPNMLFPEALNRWSRDDWASFLRMLKAFGFTCFEYWLVPTLFDRPALAASRVQTDFAATMRDINDMAHSIGLKTKVLLAANTIGPNWYFACPNDHEDKQLILALWGHWMRELAGTDIIGIFPGDVGGCNRNGCDHETFVDLCLELTEIAERENTAARVEIGTWGTPFAGWGTDMREIPGWDGSWAMVTDERFRTPETPAYIWNGKPSRARAAMEYLVKRLPQFPDDCMVAINLGFSPDGDATMGGDARPYAREVANLRAITSWDYSLSEGELINYPHWRLPRMAARRREERSAAPYVGGMSYTMTPKLNLLTMYAAGRFFLDPAADPDAVSRDFCSQVFGEEHGALGELFEAFEVVPGWGHYPRRHWSKQALVEKYSQMIEHLESADMSGCSLPLFPDPEQYREDLLWFARIFLEMAGANPDRERIRQDYWKKALAIYDSISMSADPRAKTAANQFSNILAG
jgi:hypothetical protein